VTDLQLPIVKRINNQACFTSTGIDLEIYVLSFAGLNGCHKGIQHC